MKLTSRLFAAGIGIAFSAGPTHALLVGHWKFDDGSGTTAVDSSANGYDADQGAAAGDWITGRAGGAYNLPRFGLDAADSLAVKNGGGSTVTLSVWMTVSTKTNFQGIAGFESTGNDKDVYSLKMDNTDKIVWTVDGSSSFASADTLTNYAAATGDGWVHVVGVYEQGVGSTLYVNGAVAGTGGATNAIQTDASTFAVGSYQGGNSWVFDGSIDDVQVYHSALTAADVLFLKDNPGTPLGSLATVVMGVPSASFFTDDGATLECQLFNADADDVTLVWAESDAGETDISTWTSAAGGGSHSFGGASENDVLSRAVAGLDGDTTYFFRFLATAGGDSDWSGAGSFATGLGNEPAPASPGGTAGTTTTRTKVDLSWADSYATESGFLIQRSTDPGFAGTPDEFSVPADATSFTDDTTDPNTTYFYRIAAVGSTGTGPFSANLEVTTGEAPAAGLIGHWTFDEGTEATAADSAGSGYDANQSVVAGEWVTGKAGNAYSLPRFSLDAAGSEAVKNGGGSAVTLSAWVTTRTGTNFEGIAGFENTGAANDVYSLKMDSADKINWTVDGNGVIISPDTLATYAGATADGWVHLVGVFEQGSTHTLYVNGAPVVSGANANPIQDDTSTFAIGSYQGGSGFAFTGAIDDVQVYSRALSADEVDFLFDHPGSFIGGATARFVITGIEYDPAAQPDPTVTLTWRKTGAASYIAYLSYDLGSWGEDLADSLTGEIDERTGDAEHITVTFPLEDERARAADLFFRIEEE